MAGDINEQLMPGMLRAAEMSKNGRALMSVRVSSHTSRPKTSSKCVVHRRWHQAAACRRLAWPAKMACAARAVHRVGD